MKKTNYTILEVGNSECPNIGTLIDVQGKDDFNLKLKEAINAHFDAECSFDENFFDSKVKGEYMPVEMSISINDSDIDTDWEANIEIHQTWIY